MNLSNCKSIMESILDLKELLQNSPINNFFSVFLSWQAECMIKAGCINISYTVKLIMGNCL